MRRRLAFTLAASALLALPAAAAMPMLTVDGLEGVRIGMTLEEAEKVTGPLTVSYPNDDEGCGEAVPQRPWIPGVALMVEGRRIGRIDIFQGRPPEPRATTTTDAGIGIGSTIAEVRRAYGRRLEIGPHPYGDEHGRYLIVRGLKRGREIIFETLHGRVDSFRAGRTKQVEYIEGCS